MPNRNRYSKRRFDSDSFMSAAYDRPLASAAAAAGVAAASAFLWSRRGQIGEAFSSGLDRLSEFRAEHMGPGRSQTEFAEEALAMKESGRKSRGSRGPTAQQEIKTGINRTR